MAKLLDVERNGARLDRTWMHTGRDGQKQISVEMTEDVEPIFRSVKDKKQNSKLKDFRFKAEISEVVITDFCQKYAGIWGVSPREAFSEIISGKTDRAKTAMKILTEGRDFRKFQAKNY